MRILHLMAGLGETSGVANIARRFARAQIRRGDAAVLLAPARKWNPVYFGLSFAVGAFVRAMRADEIWVHCSWTFPVWYGGVLANVLRRRLIAVPEGSFDPKRRNNHAAWKKRLVGPLDRWVLRRADEVLALCGEEMEWVRAFEPSARVRFERVPTFCGGARAEAGGGERRTGPLRVLFLGRAEDPLKGVRYLERAVAAVNRLSPASPSDSGLAELRIVTDHRGEELERDWAWCDLLCLPTLSENFGLVVAEALERGKPVVTTDGAPAWDPSVTGTDYGGRLVYLKGFRDGTPDARIRQLTEILNREAVAKLRRRGVPPRHKEEETSFTR